MTSRAFAATSDGVCNLSGEAFAKGTPLVYLTCAGTGPLPAKQVEKSNKANGYSTGYRQVPTGEYREVGKGRMKKALPIFRWEERVGNKWIELAVWEKIVTVQSALDRGFKVFGVTAAHKGSREVGMAHKSTGNVTEVVNTAPDITKPYVPEIMEVKPSEVVGIRIVDDMDAAVKKAMETFSVRPMELD